MQETISYSREVCICPACNAKHNKKIKGTIKAEVKDKKAILLGKDCPHLKGELCGLMMENPSKYPNLSCKYKDDCLSCPDNQ